MCQWKLWFFLNVYATVTYCFNVDHTNYASYVGPPSSMFGFSLAVHKESNNAWLIIGAPEAQSSYQSGVYRGGAVYKCPVDRDGNCQEIPFDTKGDNFDQTNVQLDNKTEQWFGATVTSSGSQNGPVVACAPRYTWYPRRKSRRDPVGTCYVSNGAFNHFNEYSPCRTYQWGYHRQGSCQAGFSAAINSVGDRLFMGAPGSWYWQGQMYSIDAQATFEFKPALFSATYGAEGQVHQQSLETRPAVFSTTEGTEKDDDSYMGYSTIVGDFLGNGEQGIAAGMPRGNNLKGKVLLFTWNLTNFLHLSSSDQLGSYYGYALAASDVDGDGKVDLIVGAPMYTITNNEGKYDVGRVYVIYHQSDKGMFVATYVIDGFNSKSRFGQALASLGDINQDGYGDFAVGAPYDGPNQKGAIYIYHGSSKGVRKKYSQVIYAEDVQFQGGLSTFGFSITGGLDLDGNEYPDMAVGAYLSDKAFFFRSRPVVRVEAKVRFLTKNKEVDIKESNYVLRNGKKATLTQIDFCISYSGKGIPQYIDLNLQYALDSKKTSNPRMGFVDVENTNVLNDTIRIYKDRAETCRRKEVYVLSDIRDKLTALVAEVKYWMQDDSISAYALRRDPGSVLKPILDLNQPPSRKDSISVHKECGDDNICIPNLGLTVTPSDDKYLLGSKEHLYLEVFVANTGEDSFETTLEVKYPENIYYSHTKDETVGAHVLCNTYNNTLKCEIGNPIPKDRTVKFKIFWQPTYKKNMPSTYDFSLLVNSTNQEQRWTLSDNVRNISVGIWSDSRLDLRGKSHPGEVFFNTSLYTANISQQSQYTLPADRLPENVIGPQVIHVYYVKNEGPAAIEETELFFAWPAYTLSGEDFLYLLEPPHFSPSGKVTCGPIPANYRGFNVEVSQKSIWDRLNLNVATESSAAIGATVGGGTIKVQESINKAVESSGDSWKAQQERHNASSNQQSYNIGGGSYSSGNINNKQNSYNIGGGSYSSGSTDSNQQSYNIGAGGYSSYSNQTHFRNSSGLYSKITGNLLGGKQASNFVYRCLKRVNGKEEEVECGPNFTYPAVNNTWLLQQGGYQQSGNMQYRCFEEINGQWRPVVCGSNIVSSGGVNTQQSGANIGTKINIIHKCREEVNGVWRDVPCGADGQFREFNSSAYGTQYGGKLRPVEQGFRLIHECYQTVNGVERKVDCGDLNIAQGGYAQGVSQSGYGQQSAQSSYGQRGEGQSGSVSESRQGGVSHGSQASYGQRGESESNYGQGSVSATSHRQQGGVSHGSQASYGQSGASQQGVSQSYGQGRESQASYGQQGRVQSSYEGQREGQNVVAHSGYGQQGGATSESSYGARVASQSRFGQSGVTQTSYVHSEESQSYGQQTEVSQSYGQHTGGSQSYGQHTGGSQSYGQHTGGSQASYEGQRDEHNVVSQSGQGAASQTGGSHSTTGQSHSSYDGRSYGQGGSQSGYEQTGASYGQHRGVQSSYEQRGSQAGYAGQSGQQSAGYGHSVGSQSIYGQSTGTHSQTENTAVHGAENNEDYEEEYDDYEEDTEKSITSYIGHGQASSEVGQGRRDPKTYGKYGGSRGQGQNAAESAALGNHFRVATLDLGDFGGTPQQGHKVYHGEAHWSQTHDIPQNYQNTVDNVRVKRQVLDNHPSIPKVAKQIDCKAVQCVYLRCVVGSLEENEEISIALRGRINARVLRNISSSEPLTFSSVMAARINKLPYIGTPSDQQLESREIISSVSRTEAEIKPDIVPLWVVVLSAVAGSIILLLLVLLLYKVGFFKRNRPTNAPERQPLNRNGYHHGDEAL